MQTDSHMGSGRRTRSANILLNDEDAARFQVRSLRHGKPCICTWVFMFVLHLNSARFVRVPMAKLSRWSRTRAYWKRPGQKLG